MRCSQGEDRAQTDPKVFENGRNTFIIVFIDCITIPQHCMIVGQLNNPSQISNNSNSTLSFRAKYKTEKCRYWVETGACPFGQMCAFAHFQDQIRHKGTIHSRYKTKPCLNFHQHGYCKYGERCLFLHSNYQSNTPKDCPGKTHSCAHRRNLRLFGQFGQCVFESHMRVEESRVLQWKLWQGEMGNLSTDEESLGWQENIDEFSIEQKKYEPYCL